MATNEDEPHEQRRGTLRSGNPSGDWTTAARCGAMNRQHSPCKCPAMRNRRRCRFARWQEHGPENTGRARSESARAVDAWRVFPRDETTSGRQSPPMARTLRVARQHPVGQRSAGVNSSRVVTLWSTLPPTGAGSPSPLKMHHLGRDRGDASALQPVRAGGSSVMSDRRQPTVHCCARSRSVHSIARVQSAK